LVRNEEEFIEENYSKEMMKMYAVELFLEAPFEEYVRGIWKGLSEGNISSEMQDILDLRPHITLAVYDDIPNLDSYLARFTHYFENVQEISLKFDVLALFPTSGTLFLNPTVTEELLGMHKEYHRYFDELIELANPYSIPKNWDPHCTLAIRLSQEKIIEAMKYCYRDFTPRRSKITEVGVIKLEYDANHKCKCSPTIHAMKLRG
jgi:2'-5' RNA ligase